MKILYTPLMIVPSLSAEQRAGILAAAGLGTVLVEGNEPARQRAELVDTDFRVDRMPPDHLRAEPAAAHLPLDRRAWTPPPSLSCR
jgi:hypothetical protein